ncbi:MAG: hypothetical protein IMF19_07400 [Proteobacteria bacterium]|nr:hypothetical protein [Pseudomonadota bacterium]
MNSKEESGAPLNRADVVPDCCNTEMQPIYRYMEGGIVRRIFECNGCGYKTEVQIGK